MVTWLKDLRRSRFRIIPAIRLTDAMRQHGWALAQRGIVEDRMRDVLRECDGWLAERRPVSGKSAGRVEYLRSRIKTVLG